MAKSARLKKKHQKQKETALLQSKGYTEREARNLSTSERQKKVRAYEAAQKREQAKQERIESWKALGVPDWIISRDKLWKKENDNLTARQKSEIRRRAEKEEYLKNIGVAYTKSDLRKSWDKLAQQYPDLIPPGWTENPAKKAAEQFTGRITVSEYLYVGFADPNENGFHRLFSRKRGGKQSLDSLSFLYADDLRQIIHERLLEAKLNVDDSSNFAGVAKVLHGSKDDMEREAAIAYQAGYNFNPKHLKLDRSQYMKLTISNSWEEEEFLEMVATVICQIRNDAVPAAWKGFKGYCNKTKLPFLKGFPSINYFNK